MKRLFILLFSLLLCVVSYADTYTMDWYMDGESYAQTTCQTGEDIILPQTPYKYGYTFDGWVGYTPVEYLERRSSTPYIDTGFVANQDTRVVVDQQTFQCSSSIDSVLVCSWSSYNSRAFCIRGCGNGGAVYYVSYGNNNVNYSLKDDLKRHVLDLNKNKFYIDGQLQLTFNYNNFYTPGNLSVFSGTSSYVRVFSVKIYDNDVLVRDFIPVLDKNGTPCMYDKVTQQFFYNQGTGQFIAGPAI